MSTHPVQFHFRPAKMHRVQVVIRLVFLAAVAAIGCSSIYWLLYLALPAAAALLVSRAGGQGYLLDKARGIVGVLRWLSAAYAYLWLLTDDLPAVEARGVEAHDTVELTVDVAGNPTAGTALMRLITSLPALLLLTVLSIVAAVAWVLGAVSVLATERMPASLAEFIAMKLRYQFRLAAYHLSLVESYPSLEDLPLSHAPHSGAA